MKKFSLFGAVAFLLALPLAACGADIPPTEPNPLPPLGELAPDMSLPNEPDLPVTPDMPPPDVPAEKRYIAVRASALNVRTGAGTGYPLLGRAERGVLLALNGEAQGWYRTSFRGTDGYVSAAYADIVTLSAENEAVERVIAEGVRLLGTPYVYGATRFHDGTGRPLAGFSEDAFDCSSLMQYIFYRGAGVCLELTTRTQVGQGEHVPREEIRRGDLLFFTNAARFDKTGLERIGHVGLYLGENYILHTASDYAKIEQLSPRRQSYFLEARRLL